MSSTGTFDILYDTGQTQKEYLVETSIFEVVTGISLILSILLVLSSTPRFSAQPVAYSKRFFHCVVTLCCVLNVIKSIDNQQVFHRYGSNAYIVIFLTNNITPSLMMGGAVLIYNTIDVQYRINKTATPKPLMWLLGALSVLNYTVINICTALAVTQLKQLWYIVVLYYMVASFSVLLIIADVSVWQVRSLVVKFQDRTSHAIRGKALAAEKSLYPLYAFVIFLNCLLAVVVAALLYQAIMIDQNHKTNEPPDRADPTKWSLDIFAWVHVLAIFVFIWWSWVPLHVLRPIYRKFGYETDETTRLSGHNQENLHGRNQSTHDVHGSTIMTTMGPGGVHSGGHRASIVSMHPARLSGGAGQPILVQAKNLIPGAGSAGDLSGRQSKRSSGSGKLFAQNLGVATGNGNVTNGLPPSHHNGIPLSGRKDHNGNNTNYISKPALVPAATLTNTTASTASSGYQNPDTILFPVGAASISSAQGTLLVMGSGNAAQSGIGSNNLPSPPLPGSARFQGKHTDDVAELSISREGEEHDLHLHHPALNQPSEGDSPNDRLGGGGGQNQAGKNSRIGPPSLGKGGLSISTSARGTNSTGGGGGGGIGGQTQPSPGRQTTGGGGGGSAHSTPVATHSTPLISPNNAFLSSSSAAPISPRARGTVEILSSRPLSENAIKPQINTP